MHLYVHAFICTRDFELRNSPHLHFPLLRLTTRTSFLVLLFLRGYYPTLTMALPQNVPTKLSQALGASNGALGGDQIVPSGSNNIPIALFNTPIFIMEGVTHQLAKNDLEKGIPFSVSTDHQTYTANDKLKGAINDIADKLPYNQMAILGLGPQNKEKYSAPKTRKRLLPDENNEYVIEGLLARAYLDAGTYFYVKWLKAGHEEGEWKLEEELGQQLKEDLLNREHKLFFSVRSVTGHSESAGPGRFYAARVDNPRAQDGSGYSERIFHEDQMMPFARRAVAAYKKLNNLRSDAPVFSPYSG